MAKLIRVVIDTDSYAGNFERDLCAYVTGQYGECEVGKDLADNFSKDIEHIEWWEKNIVQRSDPPPACSCERPVKIYKNKEGVYHSLAIYVKKHPSEKVLSELIERVKYFCANKKMIEAENHNIKIKDERALLALTLCGMNTNPIDLSTIDNNESKIIPSGIRIFEGAKNEILISENIF